ncbi:MAG: DUF3710 domain-containing protein [Pseudonocardiaceae bacterium]
MFGRRRRAQQQPPGEDAPEVLDPEAFDPDGVDPDDSDPEDSDPEAFDQEPASGPFDAAEEPDDGRIRLDLGSLRLPIPEGAQLQVEVDRSGPVRAVHLMTALGQLTVTAFAAPRSARLWTEVARELVARLRTDGAQVARAKGEWGEEIEAITPDGVLRFLAVDGPRWMLRGVAAGPAEYAEARAALLRDVIRETVVVRGAEPLPVRSPLPLQLPGALADQLKLATAGQDDSAAGSGPAPFGA